MKLIRVVAAGIIGLAAAACGSAVSFAEVVVDGTAVDATINGDRLVAKVKLVNTDAESVDIPKQFNAGPTGCSIETSGAPLQPLQSTTVTLTFDPDCITTFPLQVTIPTTGSANLPTVTISAPPPVSRPWEALMWGGIAGIIALIVSGIAGIFSWRSVRRSVNPRTSDGRDPQGSAYRNLQEVVNQLMPALGRRVFEWVPELPADTFELKDPIANLESGWSFKDSFVANATVGVAAFVALATSVDALTAVLGEEPKGALETMTVAGLISAILVAISSLLTKILGSSTEQVTVGGLVLSSAVVIGASVFQAVSICAAIVRVDDADTVIRVLAVALTGISIAFLMMYAVVAVRRILAGGKKENVPTLPEDAIEAWRAESPWQREIVYQTILSSYGQYIKVADDYPKMVPPGRTASGDDQVRQRRALI